MKHRLHTLALAATLLVAGHAHAQSADGAATVTTQASGSGTLTQTSDRAEGSGRQSLLVAATEAQANLGTSTLTLRGSVAADLLQNRSGSGGGSTGLQRISGGGASGNLKLGSGVTDGRLLAPVIQNLTSDGGLQDVGAGSLNNASGASVRATGTVTRGGVRQELGAGSLAQRVLAGSADGVNVGSATLDGFLAARVDQIGQGPVGEQTLLVGSAHLTGGASLSAAGRFFGSLTQLQGAGSAEASTQRVEIGSVRGGGDALRANVNAFADATIRQTLEGVGGIQDVTVGSAVNRGSGTVGTAGVLRGQLDQVSNASRALQRVDVGSAIAGSGTVQTDATVEAEIEQVANGAGSGQLQQTVAVGTVNGTLASANTLANLAGLVVQRGEAGAGASTQTVAIGSVRGSPGLVARTDAVFSGTLVQTATRGAGNQAIAIGSVGR